MSECVVLLAAAGGWRLALSYLNGTLFSLTCRSVSIAGAVWPISPAVFCRLSGLEQSAHTYYTATYTD